MLRRHLVLPHMTVAPAGSAQAICAQLVVISRSCCVASRSHLQGMFFRTARMLEAGIKPVYVFDGQPPAAKKEELARR